MSSRDTYAIGIDPGAKGSIVILGPGLKTCEVENFGFLNGDTAERIQLLLHKYDGVDKMACVERVHSFPGQGVASSFSFGEAYGKAQAALELLSVPFTRIAPTKWQKEFVAPSTEKKERKSRLLAAAKELFPKQSVTKQNADAWLIAEYCRRFFL